MATHTRREHTVRRIDHVVPVPTTCTELWKAISAAEAAYRDHFDLPTATSTPDGALTISATDDEVLITYTVVIPSA